MDKKKRIPTGDLPAPWANPFAALKDLDLSPAPVAPAQIAPPTAPKKNRGRVDIMRQTAHRGGKTVTVIAGFTGVNPAEIKILAKEMQSACGAGGTIKEGRIEIQGDHRETVAQILTRSGFRPVFAGG